MKIFLFVIVLFLCVNSALGCSIIGYPDPPLSYIISRTDTIFIGTVVSIKTTTEKDEDGDKYRVKRIKIRVERTLKGVNEEFREIATSEALVKDSCSSKPPKFKVGEKLLIHKNYDRSTEKRPNRFGYLTTKYFKFDPQEDAEYIAKIEKLIQNPVTAIYGQVEDWRSFYSIEGIEVFLEGNGLKLSAKPGKNSEYSFENIPAGNYRIQIRFPTRAHDFYSNQETIFNPQTQTFNIEYETTLKMGESDYYYVVYRGEN